MLLQRYINMSIIFSYINVKEMSELTFVDTDLPDYDDYECHHCWTCICHYQSCRYETELLHNSSDYYILSQERDNSGNSSMDESSSDEKSIYNTRYFIYK